MGSVGEEMTFISSTEPSKLKKQLEEAWFCLKCGKRWVILAGEPFCPCEDLEKKGAKK